MSTDVFDYIRHYYWDGRNALNIKAARAIVETWDVEEEIDGLDETYPEDLLGHLDHVERAIENDAFDSGYIINIGDLVLLTTDSESDTGYAMSQLEYTADSYPDFAKALGLFTYPSSFAPKTHVRI